MSKLIEETIKKITPLDEGAMQAARKRQDGLTKPQGSLGKLEELSIQIAGIQRHAVPRINEKAIIIMAGDHGVVAEKVGNWPQEVTAQMVSNILGGGAGINVLARQAGARIVIADLGVATRLEENPRLLSRKIAHGTKNIACEPAMTLEQAIKAIETGIEIVNGEISKGLDIIGTGDMGIGNTTPSAAICAIVTGRSAGEVTGRGTGISDEQLAHKTAVIDRALKLHNKDKMGPLELLACLGGFEIGGLAGVMLGAAANRVPVVIDGFISGAAALIAISLSPDLKPYMIAAHRSAEKGHRIMLEYLGLKPLLNLDMRLGEGTGAALAIMLAEASTRILSEMATFGEANVSERTDN